MVIMTAKVSKRKILLIGLLIILAVVVLITCLKKSSGSDTPPDTAEEITEVATNEARVAFLEQFGWEVQQEPVQTQQGSHQPDAHQNKEEGPGKGDECRGASVRKGGEQR